MYFENAKVIKLCFLFAYMVILNKYAFKHYLKISCFNKNICTVRNFAISLSALYYSLSELYAFTFTCFFLSCDYLFFLFTDIKFY